MLLLLLFLFTFCHPFQPVNTGCVFSEVTDVFLVQTLLSLPDIVRNSEQLQQLVDYIG